MKSIINKHKKNTVKNMNFKDSFFKIITLSILLIITFILNSNNLIAQTLSGTVYKEYFSNGTNDPSFTATIIGGTQQIRNAEPGLAGAIIKIYSNNGQELTGSPVTTTSNGSWSYSIPIGYNDTSVVLEFVPPANFVTGIIGSTNQTTIRNINMTGTFTNLNCTFLLPFEHYSDNPKLLYSVMRGQANELFQGGGDFMQPSLYTIKYVNTNTAKFNGNQNGITNQNLFTSSTLKESIGGGYVGNIMGLAYDRINNRYFGSTFLRGNNSLPLSGFPDITSYNGISSLLSISPITGNIIKWLDFEILSGNTSICGNTSDTIGLASLGDIDISNDGKYLFVSNLKKRQIYMVPIHPDGTPPTNFSEIKIFNVPTDSASINNIAINGIGINKNGRVYFGITIINQLKGIVYSFNPNGSVSQIMTPELSINFAGSGSNLGGLGTYTTTPWNDFTPYVYLYPVNYTSDVRQLWISDIEFIEDENTVSKMLVFTRNRKMDERRSSNAVFSGNLYTACKNANNKWQLTDDVYGCPTNGSYSTVYPNQKAIEKAGFYNTLGAEGNSVCGSGIALPGFTEIGITSLDGGGNQAYHSFMSLNSEDGSRTRDQLIHVNMLPNTPDFSKIWKGNVFGDIVAVGDIAPLEIGNLVWYDINKNGIQDPNESGMAGVTVNLYRDQNGNGLYDNGTDVAVASAITDANGNYYFKRKSDGTLTATGGAFIGSEKLDFYTNYLLAVDNPANFTTGNPLFGKSLTLSNVLLGGDSDGLIDTNNPYSSGSRWSNAKTSDGTRDNDGINSGMGVGNNTLAFSTGAPGESDHSYDFGFKDAQSCNVTPSVISANQTICLGGDPVALTEVTAATGSGSLSYQWQQSTTNCTNGYSNIIGATNNVYDAPIGLTQTTYYRVMVTNVDTSGTCIDSSNCVTVNVMNGVDAGPTKYIGCGSSTSVMIGLPAVSGVTYSWAPSTGLSATNVAQPIASPSGNITYTLTISGVGACSGSDTVSVLVDTTKPTINMPSTVSVCTGGTTTLTANGGVSYLWSNAATTASITAGVGTYTVTVTGSNGCTKSKTITVTNSQTGTIGNFMWWDKNGNGIYDETAIYGITGITVELWSATTNTLIASTVTNTGANGPGYYSFTICKADSYYVKFPLTLVGSDGVNRITKQTITNGIDNNSDADILTGKTPVFYMNPADTGILKNNNTLDVGYTCASVGNLLWYDYNQNGIYDELPSSGINGLTVELWDVTTNTMINSTFTTNDANGNPGYYYFKICSNGSYKIKFPTSLTGNYILTTQTTTSGTDNNSDANVSTGFSPIFTIDLNSTMIDRFNPTIDAGYRYNCIVPNCGTGTIIKN